MLPLRYVNRWRAAGVVLLAFAFVFALVPALWSPVTVRDVAAWDKWLHGMAFTFLAVWFSGQYAPPAFWRPALGLTAFGALIEACQYLTFHRSAELNDFYADAAGIAIGLGIAATGPAGWSLRVERWLEERG